MNKTPSRMARNWEKDFPEWLSLKLCLFEFFTEQIFRIHWYNIREIGPWLGERWSFFKRIFNKKILNILHYVKSTKESK